MKNITIGIIAHVDSGKTTLSEALLYQTGAIRSFGRVDKGTSFLDNDDLERRRGITIYSKQARFAWKDTQFTLIDTPGHADFSAELERSLQVLDYAVLMISAIDGIKGQTQTVWRLLAEYNIPTFVFFNKMDQSGADRVILWNTFKKTFTSDIADFTAKKADETYDQIAMCSEAAMNSFLETGSVDDDMIADLIRKRKLFPCFFGSALKQEGITQLLDALDRFTRARAYPTEFGARVYKILRDSDSSRVTMMKITGGILKARAVLPDGDSESKINQIRFYNGMKFTTKDEAVAGEICAVTGLKESYAGQGFGIESSRSMPLMIPILSYRVLLPQGDDPVKALPAFKTIEEETPELSVSWDEDRREISVSVMGEVQLEILTTILRERYNIEAVFDTGEVMYKETIASPVIGVGHFEPLRHYAEVHLLLEPLPAGSGLQFATRVSTDLLARNWQNLIMTHLTEKTHRGVLTGAPITDMKITLIAGKAHTKHTEGGDFRQAVYRAVRQGLMMAENVLLEPYYRFMLEIPAASIGRALNDLDRLKATFSAPELDSSGGTAIISGRGAVSLLKDYPKEISAYTQGTGHITFANDGYDICHNAEEIVLGKCYDPQADIRNTPDSVFCSHGSGVVVPYDEVYEHMHLSLDGAEDNDPDESERIPVRARERDINLGTEEIDAIIARISMSNSKDKKKPGTWKRRFGDKDVTGPARAQDMAAAAKIQVFPIEEADCVVVDGYNVIFAWPELSELARDNLDSARDALIDILSGFQSMISGKVLAVFDAYRVKNHIAERMVLQDVQIIYTGEDETADQFIEKYTNSMGKKSKIAVVTSDGLEQIIIRGQGCMLISSREFRNLVDRLRSQMVERFDIR